jgi:hypothetical protein
MRWQLFVFPKVPDLDPAAIGAVRNSMPGKLLGRTGATLAAVVVVLSLAAKANNELTTLGLVLSPQWLNPALLILLPIIIIGLQLFNEWHAQQVRQRAIDLAIKPTSVPEDYFRIGPYLDNDTDRDDFVRADCAHEKVLAWLKRSDSVPLYLTGDSGTGKSSLLHAFVFPKLRTAGWTTMVVRAGQDAEAAIRDACATAVPAKDSPFDDLQASTERHSQLLIVFDQFEEFLILSEPEKQRAFAQLLVKMRERPIKGLKILLVLRSDYQTALEDAGLPPLLQGVNFFQLGRFGEEAARNFFKASGLGLKNVSLDLLLRSAAELDDTPGLIRPITLNVIGYVLRQRGGEIVQSLDAGVLVRGHIARVVENPAIRTWAPAILEKLLTEQGTKRPRKEEELTAETRLRAGEVRAVLNGLAEAGLARPLTATQATWELSHDFIARVVARYLGRRKSSFWRLVLPYAVPAFVVFGIAIGVVGFVQHQSALVQTRIALADRGLSVEAQKDGYSAVPTRPLSRSDLEVAIPLLYELPHLRVLSLENSPVADLNSLNGLTALQDLRLISTRVTDLGPLKGLTALRVLKLDQTQVKDLGPLKGFTALRELWLENTPVTDLDPLKELTALTVLRLGGTHVTDLGPLKELNALQSLGLQYTQVSDLGPLNRLRNIEALDLGLTQVADLDPLKRLTALQDLRLNGTHVTDLDPLKELTALRVLDLDQTHVKDLGPLKGLIALQSLNLRGTQVTDTDLALLNNQTRLRINR